MSSTEQPSSTPVVLQAPQPSVSAANPVAATVPSVKTPAKRVVRNAATKVAPTAKTAASTVAKPAVKAAVKTVAKTTPKAVALPTAKTPAVAPTKTVVKTAVKTTAKVEPIVAKVPEIKPKSEKLLKDKKPKLVRDSFTIPKLEYLLLDQLKQRSGTLGTPVKKSELIRAGIKALAAMADASFLAAVKAVPTIKTGRPSKV